MSSSSSSISVRRPRRRLLGYDSLTQSSPRFAVDLDRVSAMLPPPESRRTLVPELDLVRAALGSEAIAIAALARLPASVASIPGGEQILPLLVWNLRRLGLRLPAELAAEPVVEQAWLASQQRLQ